MDSIKLIGKVTTIFIYGGLVCGFATTLLFKFNSLGENDPTIGRLFLALWCLLLTPLLIEFTFPSRYITSAEWFWFSRVNLTEPVHASSKLLHLGIAAYGGALVGACVGYPAVGSVGGLALQLILTCRRVDLRILLENGRKRATITGVLFAFDERALLEGIERPRGYFRKNNIKSKTQLIFVRVVRNINFCIMSVYSISYSILFMVRRLSCRSGSFFATCTSLQL